MSKMQYSCFKKPQKLISLQKIEYFEICVVKKIVPRVKFVCHLSVLIDASQNKNRRKLNPFLVASQTCQSIQYMKIFWNNFYDSTKILFREIASLNVSEILIWLLFVRYIKLAVCPSKMTG